MFDSCAEALARSAGVCDGRLVEAHPFFGVTTEQTLQATPSDAHNLLAGACGRGGAAFTQDPQKTWTFLDQAEDVTFARKVGKRALRPENLDSSRSRK